MAAGKFISYLRVSTERQGRSGLGLEAQRSAVANYLGEDGSSLAEFVEIESGKDDRNRPELTKALGLARVTGAVLLIAKLDRLSRDAHFLLGLERSGVTVRCADMPEIGSGDLTFGVLALIAQHERKMISARTCAALAVVKDHVAVTGQRKHPHVKRLGNPNGAAALRRAGKGNMAAIASAQARTAARDADLAPIIADIRNTGANSLRAIATELNRRGITTLHKTKWYPAGVQALLKRLG
jgi:DNA invertase Pin-like site-specific DNA recombinase